MNKYSVLIFCCSALFVIINGVSSLQADEKNGVWLHSITKFGEVPTTATLKVNIPQNDTSIKETKDLSGNVTVTQFLDIRSSKNAFSSNESMAKDIRAKYCGKVFSGKGEFLGLRQFDLKNEVSTTVRSLTVWLGDLDSKGKFISDLYYIHIDCAGVDWWYHPGQGTAND